LKTEYSAHGFLVTSSGPKGPAPAAILVQQIGDRQGASWLRRRLC